MAPVSRYSHQVKEAAFRFCCQNLSAAKIARRIPEIFGDDVRPDPRTVNCWIQKGDWLARRKRIHRKTEVLAEQQLARTTAKLLAGLSYLREKILSASTSLEFKSAEGVVRSLATLQRVIKGLTRPKEGADTGAHRGKDGGGLDRPRVTEKFQLADELNTSRVVVILVTIIWHIMLYHANYGNLSR